VLPLIKGTSGHPASLVSPNLAALLSRSRGLMNWSPVIGQSNHFVAGVTDKATVFL